MAFEINGRGVARVGAGRPSYASKEIEAAILHAESLGWTVKLARGQVWGRIYSPQGSRDRCRISVWSTPRLAEAHAREIMRIVERVNRPSD